MRFILLTITIFTFFVMISCNQAKKDSEQASEPSTIQEPETLKSPDFLIPVETETIPEPALEANNEEVMLNPPHGEPFHRCDIPVGAPLNSSPKTTTMQNTTPQAAPVQVQTPAPEATQAQSTVPRVTSSSAGPTIENAQRLNSPQARSNSAPAKPTGAKPRLNPAHGQPWHRCDIAVGSPLP
jgi:hypothetical protein